MGRNSDFQVNGISPFGGNSVEGTTSGFAAVRNTDVQKVPLVWDHRVQAYISELAKEELDDRDISLKEAELYNRDEEFRQRAGYSEDANRS